MLLEESKKPLNERRRTFKQKLRKGASADIFDDADLSDAMDRRSLNLNDANLSSKSFKNANFNQTDPESQPDHLCGANFRDRNLNDMNLNSKDEVKFQNLNPGGVSSRGAKTRDYDKEPLVIKDYITIVYIITIAVLLCFAMFINLVFNIPYDRKVANILLICTFSCQSL